MIKKACLPALVLAFLIPAASASAAIEPTTQYGLGIPTPGNGGISTPFGIDVSPDGTVVTTDIGFTRVSLFSQEGRFLRAFGSDVAYGGGTGLEVCTTDCKPGSPSSDGAGEILTPYGVAATATEIYVADGGGVRISVFDYQGKFLRAFGPSVGGPGVNLCTTSCVTGTATDEAGGMAAPSDVAFDASGNAYVSDLGLNRVSVFNPQTGQFIRAFGKDVGGPGVNVCTTSCQVGTADGSPGSISTAFSLTVSGGEVYVPEVGESRISVFAEDGTFRRTFGSPGEGAGQLAAPYGVAIDPATSSAYVIETGSNRLSTFGTGGDFRNARGADVIPGEPLGVEVCTTVCKAGTGEFNVGGFTSPFAVATDCRGAVYVGMVGRVEKFADPALRKPPCPSSDFTIGKVKKNKKKGTLTVDVTLPGPGTLAATLGKKLSAKVPQPQAAGTIKVTVKAAGKGVKTLSKKGKLKGNLKLTFTPPNGDPNAESKKLTLAKKLKKKKNRSKKP